MRNILTLIKSPTPVTHHWHNPTHTPSSPLNHSFSQGVHACNYIRHSADHCLNPWSVIQCHYKSWNLCSTLSSSQTPQGMHACLMRYYPLIATPPTFSRVLDLVLEPVSMGDQTWGDHLLLYKERNCAWLASLIPHLYTHPLCMHITLAHSLVLTCSLHSLSLS